MKTTTQEFLNSKTYFKNENFNLPSPFEILTPLEIFNPTIELSDPIINKNDDGTENISFGRIKIERHRDNDTDKQAVAGAVIAFDLGKPLVKIYRGTEVKACTNLCIFSAEHIHKVDLLTGWASISELIFENFSKSDEYFSQYEDIEEELRKRHLTLNTLEQFFGNFVKQCATSKNLFGIRNVNKAAEMLFNNRNSLYNINSPEGFTTWHLYNNLTQVLTDDENFFDRPEKTLSAYNLIKSASKEIFATDNQLFLN